MFRQLIGSEAGSPDSFSIPFPGGEISLNSPKQLFVLSSSHNGFATESLLTPPATHMGLTTSISSKIPFIAPTSVTFPVPTFTRTSIAMFVNPHGLIEKAMADTSRFDHGLVTAAPKGLLLEAEGTNLISMSTDLTLWTKFRVTVTDSTNFSIFANEGVFLLTCDGTAGGKGISRTFLSSSMTRTISV